MQTSRTNDRYKTHRSSVKGEWPVVSMKTTKDHVRHLLTANKRDKKPSRFTEMRKSYWNWRFVVSRRSVYGFIADWLDRGTIEKNEIVDNDRKGQINVDLHQRRVNMPFVRKFYRSAKLCAGFCQPTERTEFICRTTPFSWPSNRSTTTVKLRPHRKNNEQLFAACCYRFADSSRRILTCWNISLAIKQRNGRICIFFAFKATFVQATSCQHASVAISLFQATDVEWLKKTCSL